MKKYIGLLLLIIAFNLSSQTIDVKTDNNLIKLTVTSISKNITQTKNNGFDYIKFKNFKYSYPRQTDNLLTDELQFVVALPENADFTIEKKFAAKKLISNSSNFNSSRNEFVTIERIGKLRGVSTGVIKINPFYFDNYSHSIYIYDSVEIKIIFKSTLTKTEFDENNPEFLFYTEYINKEHIPGLINKSSELTKYKNESILNENWYNPDIAYIKLMTKNDGIAKVTAQSLIKTENSFSGKDIRFFHLLHKGDEIPIKFYYDSDGILNDNDEIIFLGSRGAGDTTWFNNYSDYETYYLYYDEETSGLRYLDLPQISAPSSILDKVNINEHIEKEKFYFRGGDLGLQWDIENIHREGWYWQEIDYGKKRKFEYNPLILLADSVIFDFRISSINWNQSMINKHNLALAINNDTLSKFSLDTGKIINLRQKISSNNLIAGKNSIAISSVRLFDTSNKPIIPDVSAVDYMEINLKAKPVALSGNSFFTTDLLTESVKLQIPNFRTNDVLIMDKKNNYLSMLTGQNGTNIVASAKSGNFPWSSIMFNDTAFSTELNSINIAILKSPDYTITEFKSFFVLNNQIVDFINTAPAGSIIAITYNSDKTIPSNIITKIQSLGSVAITQVKPGDSWSFIVKTDDLTKAIEKLNSNGSANLSHFITHNSGKSFAIEQNLQSEKIYDLIASDMNAIEDAEIYPVRSSTLRNVDNSADAIFITHGKFKSGTDMLADYRRSKGFVVEVVDVEDVYKEFNYGIKSPHAIRSFLRYAYNKWQKPSPKFLLLIGDGCWDSRNKEEGSVNIDYIPSYGWPVSDHWYTCLDEGTDYLHDMLAGRIPANDNNQIISLLNKLKEYDTIPKMPWMKKILSLTGGGADGEKEIFKDNMDGILYAHWMETPFAGDTMVVAKKSIGTVGVAEASEIIRKIDAGAVWINFYGHGAPDVFDMDGWDSEKLNNKGKYPFFTTISCNTAAFAEPIGISRNEDYLMIAEKGFIGTGGSTNLGMDIPGMQMVSNMMDVVVDTLKRQRFFGEIVNNAKIIMVTYDSLTRAYAQQFILLGDPMTEIRISKTRDIYTLDNEINVTNPFGNTILIETDTIAKVNGFVYNNGYCEKNNLQLRLIHKYQNYIDTSFVAYSSLCIKETFLFDSLDILNKPGVHEITIDAILTDTLFNVYSGNFEVFKSGLLPLEPLPYWNMTGNDLHFRFIHPVQNNNSEFEFYLSTIDENNDEKNIYQSNISEINVLENCIDWLPDTVLDSEKEYFVYARYINQNLNIESNWLRIPFHIQDIEIEKADTKLENEFLNHLKLENIKIFDENDKKVLRFDDFKKLFRIISAKGNTTVDRFCEIEYDNELYIVTPSTSNAPVGINLIVVSGKDGKYITTKKYNTWDGENSTRNLVNFLNDSVETGDWLMLASCGGAWRMFYWTGVNNPDAPGSFKTFKAALNNFGAIKANEIPETSDITPISFAFVGRKGSQPGEAFETMVHDGNKITIADSIIIYQTKGKIQSPVIYSAKKWNDCKIDSDIDFSNASTTLSVVGIPVNGAEEILASSKNSISADLSSIDAKIYQKLKLDLDITRLNEEYNFKIDNVEINFAPSPELAMIQSKSKIIPDTVMRGEETTFQYYLENLSLRSSANNIYDKVSLQPDGLSELIYSDTISTLQPNENIKSELDIQTFQLTEKNIIKAIANFSNSNNELYKFNNSTQRFLHLRRDNEKPFIKIKADGVVIHDSAYVSKRPYFEIELYDYSFEPVLAQPEPMRVWINSYRRTIENSEDYNLNLVNKDEFKAVLGFKSDTLFDWDNRIEVVFQDAAGNMDTVEYHIFTSINAYITHQKCEPNPVNELANITFSYRASDNSGTAIVSIYDIAGRKIRTLMKNLVIGKNELEWDGTDILGNSVSQGVYLFFIEARSPYYSEPVTGKLIRLNP